MKRNHIHRVHQNQSLWGYGGEICIFHRLSTRFMLIPGWGSHRFFLITQTIQLVKPLVPGQIWVLRHLLLQR